MARSHFRHTISVGTTGKAVQNALVHMYLPDTTTPVTDAWSATTAGSSVTMLLSNDQSEVECWFDSPQEIDVLVTDNSHNAYNTDNSSTKLTFADFTERVSVLPPADEVGRFGGVGGLLLGLRTGPDSPDAVNGGPGQDTAFGFAALSSLTGANNPVTGDPSGTNTAFGHQAAAAATSAASNDAFGWNALRHLTTGVQNAGFGAGALQAITDSINNTALGFNALYHLTTGQNNTAVGYAAGYNGADPERLTAVGYSAGYGVTADDNTAIGTSAMGAIGTNPSGIGNTAVGSSALQNITTGAGNVAIGYTALLDITTGSDNIAIGQGALRAPAGVTANATKVGIGNTAIGHQSGCSSTADPNFMTLLGWNALGAAAYSLALGASTQALASGSVAIGTDSVSAGATTSVANEIKMGTANHRVSLAALKFNAAANESTGAGSAALGANCPAVTATAPYTWEKITTSDGSTCWVPAWK